MSTASTDDRDSSARAFGIEALDVLLEQLPGAGLCRLDPAGHIEHWHASAESLLGHRADQISGQALESLFPEERRFEAALPRALFAASAAGRQRVDAGVMTRSGERRVCVLDIHPQFEPGGDVAGFIVLLQSADSAPTREARTPDADGLEAAHRANLAVVQGEPAWLGLDMAVRIARVSGAASATLDRRKERLLGRPLAECLVPVEPVTWPVLLHRCVRQGEPILVSVRAMDEAGPGEAVHSLQLAPLKNAAGTLDGFTLVIRRRNVEAMPVARAVPGPKQAAETADSSWLLAAAHDLREPLRKMQRFAQTLQAGEAPRLTDGGRRQLESIQGAAERMQAMVSGMLRLARVDAGEFSRGTVDLRGLIDEVRADLAVLVEEHDARIDVGPLGHVIGDAAQLRALFQNLIDNSIRYRREGVAPQIRIQPASGAAPAGGVVIDYQDNARGIEASEEAFSPFRSRDAGERGTGLGLPLCRRICHRHRGDIVIRETDKTGTIFRITLGTGAPAGDDQSGT